MRFATAVDSLLLYVTLREIRRLGQAVVRHSHVIIIHNSPDLIQSVQDNVLEYDVIK